jgi:hypothetical protein
MIVTSFERAGSPLGSGLFQLTPKAWRSMTASSVKPKRSPPYWSAIGSEMTPVSSTRSVWPLIVISPSIRTRSPSRSTEVDSKVSSGWRSASKKSGD